MLERARGMLRSPRLPRSTALTIDGSSPRIQPPPHSDRFASFTRWAPARRDWYSVRTTLSKAASSPSRRSVSICRPNAQASSRQALEALAGRGLSHPSIAAPIGAGMEDGIAWFAQAYVPAESLDSALRQYGPPPVADALAIVTQLAGALDFAAAAGVLHGVAASARRARRAGRNASRRSRASPRARSSPAACVRPYRRPYSAPERGRGGRSPRGRDIFALGAIAFELLSGDPVTGAGDDVVVGLPDVPGATAKRCSSVPVRPRVAPDERYRRRWPSAPLKKALGDALTRPAAPRKRRTTRPPEAMSPDGGARAEPMPPPSTQPPVTNRRRTRPVDPPSRRSCSACSCDSTLPDRSGARTGRRGIRTRSATLCRPRVATSGTGEPVRDDEAAPAYVLGPTEPEPSAPAVEPIAAPGEWSPVSPVEPAARYASLDETSALRHLTRWS